VSSTLKLSSIEGYRAALLADPKTALVSHPFLHCVSHFEIEGVSTVVHHGQTLASYRRDVADTHTHLFTDSIPDEGKPVLLERERPSSPPVLSMTGHVSKVKWTLLAVRGPLSLL
jgi:hypothetical protein